MRREWLRRATILGLALPALGAFVLPASAVPDGQHGRHGINHIVVIYEENHSFDNLFGGWERVDGLHGARPQTQVAPDGTPLACLPQLDLNLASPPLPVTCTGTINGQPVNSAFDNRPFSIDNYIVPTDTTCPPPGVF